MLRIDKLPQAESDLIDIWIYGCTTWNATQADSYADSIQYTLKALAHFPEKNRIRNNFRPAIRICHHVSHMIAYTVEKDSIVVVRVLHKSMDVKRHV
jgi:toxin ParE1/3/4